MCCSKIINRWRGQREKCCLHRLLLNCELKEIQKCKSRLQPQKFNTCNGPVLIISEWLPTFKTVNMSNSRKGKHDFLSKFRHSGGSHILRRRCFNVEQPCSAGKTARCEPRKM